MQTRHLLVLALLLSGLFVSQSGCDALTEEPRSVIAPDQFFQSEEEALSAVNGVYAHLYNYLGNGDGQSWDQISVFGTDVAIPTRRLDRPQHYYTLTASSHNGMDEVWRELYRGIGDANMTIRRVSESDIEQSTRERVVGEAKFLRALYYHHLTLAFGGVPLWLDPLDVDEVGGLPRTSVEEVRAQIVQDATEAAAVLPSTYSGGDDGRVTRWAAKTLRAKVHLWLEEWQAARDVTADIIENGPHRLLDDYARVFAPDNELNDEIIFSVQYVQDIRSTNHHSRHEPRGIDEPQEVSGVTLEGFGFFTSPPSFIDSFEEGDERLPSYNLDEINGVALNWTYMPKHIRFDAPRGNSGLNHILFRYADVLLMHAEAANRLNGGPSEAAYTSLNAVRRRAGLDPLSGLSQEGFHEAVMEERKHELATESHRRWDLARWGTLVEAVRAMEEVNPEGAANVEPYHRLYPIPSSEIAKNPSLEQNPGY